MNDCFPEYSTKVQIKKTLLKETLRSCGVDSGMLIVDGISLAEISVVWATLCSFPSAAK
jgi:hypothetical protein